jgi:hypothetical protein
VLQSRVSDYALISSPFHVPLWHGPMSGEWAAAAGLRDPSVQKMRHDMHMSRVGAHGDCWFGVANGPTIRSAISWRVTVRLLGCRGAAAQ